MVGCSLSKGTDMPERTEIFKAMHAEGFVFSRLNISTAYGENKDQVIVTGPMSKKTPDSSVVANGYKLTQVKKVVVDKVEGSWRSTSVAYLGS